jgi:hypothetical protein
MKDLFFVEIFASVLARSQTRVKKLQLTILNSFNPITDLDFSFSRIKNVMGVKDIIGTGLGFLFAGLFFIFILAVYGQFGTLASLWPASNVTKITTNIANSVVTASAFLTLILLIEAIGFIALILGLVEALVS